MNEPGNAHATDIGILNSLIGATADSAEAYRAAAERLDDTALRSAFQRRAAERKIVAANLQEQLVALGDSPEGADAAQAKAHAVFNDLPGAAQAGWISLLHEVRRGEARIRALYQAALDNSELSSLSLTVVRNASHSIQSGADDIGELAGGQD